MMKKTITSLFAVFMALLALFGGACAKAEKNYPVTVGGAEIADYPTAIVSLSPYISEIIYGLELSGVLVGRSTHCAFNGNVRALPDVGTVLAPNTDAIIALKPQVVFAAAALPSEDTEKLASAGISVSVLSVPETLEEVETRVIEIATALKGKNRASLTAEEYLSGFEGRLDYVSAALENEESLSAVFVLSDTLAVATGDTLLSAAMETAGLKNIAAANTGYIMSVEEIIAANPDIIVVAAPPGIDYVRGSALSELSAVTGGYIYEIENQYVESLSPEITDLIYALAYAIHGDAMAAAELAAVSAASD